MESFWDRLMDGLRDIGTAIGDWTPKIIGALLILVVGWLIARILRNIVRRLLELAPVKAVLKAAGIEGALEGSGYEPAKLGAGIVYFYLWLVVLLLAFEVLEAQTIVDLLERTLAVIPLILVAFVVLVLAAAVGRFVAGLVSPWAESHGVTWLPWITQGGFILFGLVTAFQILEIGYFTEALTTAILGGAGIAFAIAFGVGGIDTARKWWAKYLSPSESTPQRDTTP
jgi:flagellar biosynthesis protein FliQ